MPQTRRFPPHVVTAVTRLAGRIAAAAPSPRVLVVGMPDPRTLAALETALGPVTVTAAPRVPVLTEEDGSYDVVVALGWLATLREPEHMEGERTRSDPGVGLTELARVASGHLLLAVPREPLTALGVSVTSRALVRVGGQDLARAKPGGTTWSAPGFMRFASRAGAVRDVAHPLLWSLLWVRRH